MGMDEITIEEDQKQQNLSEILHICAACTGNVRMVIDTLQKCENISLTKAEKDMTRDIVKSIGEHGLQATHLTAWYLVRYGMLIGRRRNVGETTP